MKIILFTSSYLLAHLSQCIEVGVALRVRGHDVAIAGDDPETPGSKLSLAAQAGLRLARVREIDQPYVWDRYMSRGWPVAFHDLSHLKRWAPIEAILESQVRLLQQEQPDLVVGNATATAGAAAHLAGLPAASLFNGYFLDYVLRHPILRPYWRGYEWYHIAPARRRVYRRHGRKPIDALALFQSIPLVSPDLPGLYEVSEWLPRTHQTGPLPYEYPEPTPSWVAELDDGTPNVYVTMGSTGRLEPFLRNTFATLGRSPYRFIVSTAGRVAGEVLQSAPSNFRLVPFVQGGETLRHCRAMIFHGGNGTMYQALRAGVPMLSVPTHLEQRINAHIAVRNGFCRELSARRATGEAVLAAIRELVEDDSIQRATQHWAQEARQSDGPNQAADLLERIAREGRPAGAGIG